MSWTDAAGLVGVLMILAAYAGAALGRLDPKGAWSLLANLVGACLILVSLLVADFNLSATVMEGSWALVAAGRPRPAGDSSGEADRLRRASAAPSPPRSPSRARRPASGSCRGMTSKAAPIRSATAARGGRRMDHVALAGRSPAPARRSAPGPTLVVMNGSSHQFSVSRTACALSGRSRATRGLALGAAHAVEAVGCASGSRSGAGAPEENGAQHLHAEGGRASSRLEPATPQGGEGASSTRARDRRARAASCATSPPMEWPSSTGGSAQRRAQRGDVGGVVAHRDADHRARRSPARVAAQVRRDHLEAGGLERAAEALEGPAAAEGAVHHDDGGHRSAHRGPDSPLPRPRRGCGEAAEGLDHLLDRPRA